jgi:hypothetical protein
MTQGSNSGKDKRFFSSQKCPHRVWGPRTLLFGGCHGSCLVAKKPGRVIKHATPSNAAEVMNKRSYNSNPPVCLCAVRRKNCTFYFYLLLIGSSVPRHLLC